MKKNITVNIFGTLYPIDEDAYELLQKYNDNMRRYYSQREGGNEIADDVEMRVAELLTELRQRGVQAITIEHITEIINRIGDPQQMDEEPSSGSTPPPYGNTTNNEQTNTSGSAFNATTPPPFNDNGMESKKLFRDPEDRILGGVLSGLSHYLGIKDPLILRIIVVVLFFASFSSLAILYIIGWILIPEATTPEDRLRMHGKPVTAKAINEELMRGVNSAKEFVNKPQTQDAARGCLSVFVKIIAGFAAIIVGIIIISMLIGLIGALIGICFGTVGFLSLPDFHINAWGVNITSEQLLSSVPTWMTVVCIVGWFGVLCIPLFGLLRAIFHRKDRPGMNKAVKIGLIATWIACLAGAITTSGLIARKVSKKFIHIEQTQNTRDGVYLTGRSWDLLTKKGWEVAQLDGVYENVERWGEVPENMDERYIHLTTAGNPNDMHYDIFQKKELNPGKYAIDCWVNANGTGNVLYVLDADGNELLRAEIPMFESPEKEEVKEKGSSEDETSEIDDATVVSSPSQDWTHVVQSFIIPYKGIIKYGLTNKSEMTTAPWNGDCIDIVSVKVIKM